MSDASSKGRGRNGAPAELRAGAPGPRPAQLMRQLVHGRQLVCRAYIRGDGHWDIEGRLVDIKTHDLRLPAGRQVAAGEPYRALALAMTVAGDLTIRDARLDASAATPAEQQRALYACRALAGRRIDAPSGDETQSLFFRATECAHLAALLAAVVATARETIPSRQPAAPRHDD